MIKSTIYHVLAASVLFTLVWIPSLGAQIIDCRGVDSEGLKVLLDDITSVEEKAGPELVKLRFLLQGELQRLQELSSLRVLRCEGRRPRGEGDFPAHLVELLDSRDVLLEVWGTVTPKIKGSDAVMGFVSIPVRWREHGQGGETGVYEVPYSTPSSLADFFNRGSDLQGLTTLSLGIRHLQARQYDRARGAFCRAELFLRRGRRREDPLLEYIRRLRQEVVESARNDKSYMGILRSDRIGSCDGRS